MLTKNLDVSKGLVNGARGVIVKFSSDSDGKRINDFIRVVSIFSKLNTLHKYFFSSNISNRKKVVHTSFPKLNFSTPTLATIPSWWVKTKFDINCYIQ